MRLNLIIIICIRFSLFVLNPFLLLSLKPNLIDMTLSVFLSFFNEEANPPVGWLYVIKRINLVMKVIFHLLSTHASTHIFSILVLLQSKRLISLMAAQPHYYRIKKTVY